MRKPEDEKLLDEVLVSKVQAGDKAAFDELVSRYQAKITRMVHRYISDDGDAADLSQDIFLRAYCAISQFRGDSAFFSWLYRIAINTVKNFLMLKKRIPPREDVDIVNTELVEGITLLKDHSSPEQMLLRDEIETTVFDCLDEMPEDLSLAFLFYEIGELGYQEIALILNCPIGTIRSRIFRVREALDKKIAGLLER